MKIIVSPLFASQKDIRQLNRSLKRSGFSTIKEPVRGELGKGLVGGISTLLTGGQTIFTKLGDALIRHIENKKIDLTVKNTKGEELVLSAVLPREELKAMISGFFERDVSSKIVPNRKTTTKKSTKKKTAKTTTKSSSTKTKTTAKKSTPTKKTSTTNTSKKK